MVPTLKSAEPGLQDTDAKKLHMIFMATLWRPYTLKKGPFSFSPWHGSTVVKQVQLHFFKSQEKTKKISESWHEDQPYGLLAAN